MTDFLRNSLLKDCHQSERNNHKIISLYGGAQHSPKGQAFETPGLTGMCSILQGLSSDVEAVISKCSRSLDIYSIYGKSVGAVV
jgi:hypothetical protein